jgi:hypothetical protein
MRRCENCGFKFQDSLKGRPAKFCPGCRDARSTAYREKQQRSPTSPKKPKKTKEEQIESF